MGVAITKQEAVVMHLNGQLKSRDADGNVRDISIGNLIKDGEQLIFSSAANFTLQYQDGSEVTAQELQADNSNPQTIAKDNNSDQNFNDPDAEIAALLVKTPQQVYRKRQLGLVQPEMKVAQTSRA